MKSQEGFTIIEVLIAMAIFSIGILGIATLQITAIQGNSTAKSISESTVNVSSAIEDLMLMNFAD